jgi:OOP family OmpA-OmpF porin
MQKPWGKGAWWGGFLGAAAAGTSLGVATNNGSLGSDLNDSKRGGAIAVGIVGGALIGALVGHALFDPEPPPPPPPAPPPPPEPKKPLVVLKGANFAFNSASLNPAAHARLAATVDTLKANPDMRIEVRGYTDSIGSDAYNMRLSKRRAESVKSFLVSEGIAADRITTDGFGPASPVADNSTKEGQAENRRVEVHDVS